MHVTGIPYKNTGYFSSLINDYVEESSVVKPFYHRFPHLENFNAQIKEKAASFSVEQRTMLCQALEEQYKNCDVSDTTKIHLAALKKDNTFTVITGHQLNLFTGPLYFLYKIIHTINLAKALKKKHPDSNFVPVYWMATEDHDFEEINYFNFKGHKVAWSPIPEQQGGVGRFSTDGLAEVFDIFSIALGGSKNANTLKALFKEAYVLHHNLADATRYLANALFGDLGLVIVDGDSRSLKKLFVPYIKKDLEAQISYTSVTKTAAELTKASSHYKIQVNPREINYFYLVDGSRERIIAEGDGFRIHNTQQIFSFTALMDEVENHPERFSPNVICRPLYQEVILPNLCYIGGGGELAYWLQLKDMFTSFKVPFPMLLLRNSAVVIHEKQREKIAKMQLKPADLFMKQNSLVNKKIRDISNIDIDFTPQRETLQAQFKLMHQLAEETDASFLGAVKAQEVKQLKGLDALEKRLLLAQKRKLEDHVTRLVSLQNEVFPNQSLQERVTNFSELYLAYGSQLIPSLCDALDPFTKEFTIITL